MKTELVLIGEKYHPLISNLSFPDETEIIYIPDNPDVDKRLSGHADLSAFGFPDGKLVLAKYLACTDLPERLKGYGIEVFISDYAQKPDYPNDCNLNAKWIGNDLVCNPNTTDPIILQLASELGMNIISVKQGYTACSILTLDSETIATSDEGIQKVFQDTKYTVLKSINDGIHLEGFRNGFIGGCGFRLTNGTLYFSGPLSSYDTDISRFLEKKGYKRHEIDLPIPEDIGGGIVIPVK